MLTVLDKLESWLAKEWDYSTPVLARLIAFTLLFSILEEWFGARSMSSEIVLIIAIGFTLLDRQQAWTRPSSEASDE